MRRSWTTVARRRRWPSGISAAGGWRRLWRGYSAGPDPNCALADQAGEEPPDRVGGVGEAIAQAVGKRRGAGRVSHDHEDHDDEDCPRQDLLQHGVPPLPRPPATSTMPYAAIDRHWGSPRIVPRAGYATQKVTGAHPHSTACRNSPG